MLFWDRVLSVYRVKVSFSFSQRWVSRLGLSLINLDFHPITKAIPSIAYSPLIRFSSGPHVEHHSPPRDPVSLGRMNRILKLDPGRFLSYPPHSRFHSQCVALENPPVPARLFGRTLLVPPIRFGCGTILDHNPTILQKFLGAGYTAYLCWLR